MALIRNEKHDSSTDKHEQFLDSSHENRKDKYEYLKKKGKRHDNQRNNGVNTYISYRDSEADIEYEIVKWNKVRSANRQADQSINLADKGREQDQEAQCWLEATEPFSDEQLDIKANRIEPTHGNSGAVKARKQCGGTSSSMQRTEQRHAEHSDALRQEEQNSATIIGNKCDVEIIGKAGDVVKLNRGSGDKTCLLGISSLKTETRLGTREHRLNSVSKADTVDKRITNQCTNDIGLEDAKDKAFGKKRVLTEIMSNAYSMNNNHSAITRDLNDLEVDMKGSYHQDFSRKLKKYHMNGLKDNVTVNKSTEDSKQDYKNGNHHCKESETLSPKRLLSDEQIFQDEKRSAEETNNVGIQGETNGQHTGHERSNNDISKTGKVSAQEQKVHRFIDETDNHDETPYLDNTVKSAYEELNVSRHGTFSDKTDFEIEKQTEEKKLDVPIKTDHCSEIPYIRQKNGKGKQLNKDNYATESRAALKAMTKSNLLHRRHSSEGALDSRLEDLFLETRWRPLSTDFQDYVAIVAIDFGTAYSGYAYCFTNHTGKFIFL